MPGRFLVTIHDVGGLEGALSLGREAVLPTSSLTLGFGGVAHGFAAHEKVPIPVGPAERRGPHFADSHPHVHPELELVEGPLGAARAELTRALVGALQRVQLRTVIRQPNGE
jgi:hypothetical protein